MSESAAAVSAAPSAGPLTADELEAFARDGVVRVRAVFTCAEAERMQAVVWRRLADFGVARDDRSTWSRPFAQLNRVARDRAFRAILGERLRGAFDQLAGAGRWATPTNWGLVAVTFPHGDAGWRLASDGWHWDCDPRDPTGAFFVLACVDDVAPGGGGTLVVAGAPRALARYYRELPEAHRGDRLRRHRARFGASDPWLAELTGAAPDGGDRTARFIGRATSTAAGDHFRVVEACGDAGDVLVCHASMLHVGSRNAAERPRMMRIATVRLAPPWRADALPSDAPLARAIAPIA